MAPVVTRLITIHVSGQMDSTHTKFILIKMMHYSLKSSEMDLDATEQSSPVLRLRIEGISLFFFFFFFLLVFVVFPKGGFRSPNCKLTQLVWNKTQYLGLQVLPWDPRLWLQYRLYDWTEWLMEWGTHLHSWCLNRCNTTPQCIRVKTRDKDKKERCKK